MFETIRRLIMCRYQEKKVFIDKVKGNICPIIHDMLEARKQKSFDYEPLESGHGLWEVTSHGAHFVVNLHERTCSCRQWDITGIPCTHACAAIMHDGKDATKYVHQYFTVEYYKKTYMPVIIPIPNADEWIQTGSLPIDPPKLRKRPGRPKKMRIKGPDEIMDHGVVSRMGSIMHCNNCKQAGHNKRSCKEPTAQEESNPSHSTRRGNARAMDRIIGSTSVRTSNGETTSSQKNGRGSRNSMKVSCKGVKGTRIRSAHRGPYSGYGNWNGIGMSNMTKFTPANQIARMVMHQNSDSHSVQMRSTPFNELNQVGPSTAPTVQIQRQASRFGDVLFSTQSSHTGVYVHKDIGGTPNEYSFDF